MKYPLLNIVFLCTLLCLGTTSHAVNKIVPGQTAYNMHKGINISTWIVYTSASSGSEVADYFTKSHFDELVRMGFNHFRLPFSEKILYKSISPIVRDTVSFRLVHNFIGWCQEAGVTVALNYHIPRADKSTLGGDNTTGATERAKMVNVWNDLSLAFGHYPNETLAYEVFNEPNFSSNTVWNSFANAMISKIREREQGRIIILGPNGNNDISKLPYLSLPADKKNLVVSVHFYAPSALSHYNVGGLKGIFVRLNYPGQIFTSAALAELTQAERDKVNAHSGNFTIETQKTRLQPLLDFAATNNVRIRCGEYGANDEYEKAYNDKDIKVRYFQDVVQVFDELNIPHCLWGYKSSFGIFNEADELNDPRVVKAITGYDITTVAKNAGNTLKVRIYPVPASINQTINIEADFEQELLQNAVVEMYNLSGIRISSVVLTKPITGIVMPDKPGMYILSVKSKYEIIKSLSFVVL